MDFNQRWLAFILGEWDIPLPSVVAEWSQDLDHHAEVALPSSLEGHELPRYWQVFEDQNGFIPNLSALDLLFHLGLEGRLYLNKL